MLLSIPNASMILWCRDIGDDIQGSGRRQKLPTPASTPLDPEAQRPIRKDQEQQRGFCNPKDAENRREVSGCECQHHAVSLCLCLHSSTMLQQIDLVGDNQPVVQGGAG